MHDTIVVISHNPTFRYKPTTEPVRSRNIKRTENNAEMNISSGGFSKSIRTGFTPSNRRYLHDDLNFQSSVGASIAGDFGLSPKLSLGVGFRFILNEYEAYEYPGSSYSYYGSSYNNTAYDYEMHLIPNLYMKYHFMNSGIIRPYALSGLGLNFLYVNERGYDEEFVNPKFFVAAGIDVMPVRWWGLHAEVGFGAVYKFQIGSQFVFGGR